MGVRGLGGAVGPMVNENRLSYRLRHQMNRMTYLVCGYKPLNCCLKEQLVREWDNTFGDLLLCKMTVQCADYLFRRILALLNVSR